MIDHDPSLTFIYKHNQDIWFRYTDSEKIPFLRYKKSVSAPYGVNNLMYHSHYHITNKKTTNWLILVEFCKNCIVSSINTGNFSMWFNRRLNSVSMVAVKGVIQRFNI